MKRLVGVSLLVVGVLLALTAAAACDGDNDTGGETTPTAAETPDATSDGTRDTMPDSTPGATQDTTTDGIRNNVPEEPDEELEATLRAEAEALCPEGADMERCVGAYILWATGQREMAMCVNDEGGWFFEPAQGSIGGACSAGKGDIVAIVGGE